MNRRRLFHLIAAAVLGRKIPTPKPAATHVFFFADSAGLWRQYCETPLRGLHSYDYLSPAMKAVADRIDQDYSRMA